MSTVKAGELAMHRCGRRVAVLAICGNEAMVRFAGENYSSVAEVDELSPLPPPPVVARYAVDGNPMDLRDFVELTDDVRKAVSKLLP